MVAFTFLFGLGGRTQYTYAIMLTIMSLNALVLCQVTKFGCLFCDEHGSPHYYAARVLSICLGCLAPVLVRVLHSCCMKPLTLFLALSIAHTPSSAQFLSRATYKIKKIVRCWYRGQPKTRL